ncbi:MAG: TubC N-terminal docking domain [Planctomycetaceae bacterium]|nr:TubC N-terminal docking domain [Planctomycetaceae bacterium]
MSTLSTILDELGRMGVLLYMKSHKLAFHAPEGVMNPELIQRLRDRRGELIEFLSSPDTIGLHPSHTTVRLPFGTQVLHRLRDCGSPLWWQHAGGQHACLICHPPTHTSSVCRTNYAGLIPVVDWRDAS